jgi:hypothetical protein
MITKGTEKSYIGKLIQNSFEKTCWTRGQQWEPQGQRVGSIYLFLFQGIYI